MNGTTSLNWTLLALAAISMLDAPAKAGMIQSASFSLGYGYTAGTWDDSETASVNTPAVQGDFSFTPTPTATVFSNRGPTFPNRELTTTSTNEYSARSDTFSVSIVGAYTGPLTVTPEFHIQINITELRIYAVGQPTFAEGDAGTIAFVETTAGHTATSPPVEIASVATTTSLRDADNYTAVSWDPNDYLTPGVSFTRTFALTADANRAIDGFEVFGTVILWTPEPTSAILLGIGLLGLAGRRRGR